MLPQQADGLSGMSGMFSGIDRLINSFLLTSQNIYPHTAVPRPGHGALCVDRGGAAAILQPTAMFETC